MKFIKFGKFDKKFLIPIVGGIIILIFKYFEKNNPKYEILLQNPFLISIYSSMGMVLAFIPYLILKYKSKSSNNISDDEPQDQSNLNLVHINQSIFEKIKNSKYKYILFQEIFDFLQAIFASFFCMNVIYNFWTFDIIFISLFSYLILKIKLYRHQYISMIIITILGILLNVLEYFKSGENEFDYLGIFMSFLCEILSSICIVIAKYNMEKKYFSPYEISLWIGSIGVILYIIVLLIINKLKLEIAGIQYPDNIYELFNNYDIYDFILCLTLLIVNGIYNIVLLLTCNYFTPIHTLILTILNQIYYNLNIKENITLNILSFFILILIAFIFLIFIEIIELNICNISDNTKDNIQSRAFNDSLIALIDFTEPNDDISAD